MSPPLTGLPQNTKDSPQQSVPSRGGSPASPEVTPPPPPKLWGHKDLALSPQSGTAVEGHPASERAVGSAKASLEPASQLGGSLHPMLPPPPAPGRPTANRLTSPRAAPGQVELLQRPSVWDSFTTLTPSPATYLWAHCTDGFPHLYNRVMRVSSSTFLQARPLHPSPGPPQALHSRPHPRSDPAPESLWLVLCAHMVPAQP